MIIAGESYTVERVLNRRCANQSNSPYGHGAAQNFGSRMRLTMSEPEAAKISTSG
jgi:hypothetical protein